MHHTDAHCLFRLYPGGDGEAVAMVAGGPRGSGAAPAESACVCVRVFSAPADMSACCVYYPGNLNIHVCDLHTNQQRRTMEENTRVKPEEGK